MQSDTRVYKLEILQDPSRWSRIPEDTDDQLVILNHGTHDKPDYEIRAAILPSAHEKGLFYAGNCSKDFPLGYYHGSLLNYNEYSQLDDSMGLRHVLQGRTKHICINDMNSATGMQFANTDRKTFRNNNLYFKRLLTKIC